MLLSWTQTFQDGKILSQRRHNTGSKYGSNAIRAFLFKLQTMIHFGHSGGGGGTGGLYIEKLKISKFQCRKTPISEEI